MPSSEKAAETPGAGLPPALLVRTVAAVRRLLTGSDAAAKVQRDAAVAFLVRAFSAAILYLSQIVLARWMGSFEYGIYVFVWTWVLVLGGLSNLGLPTAMMRLLPRYAATGEAELARGLLLTGRLFPLLASTAVAIGGLCLLRLQADLVPAHYQAPILVALLCLPMVALSDVQDGIGRAQGWMTLALLPPYVVRPLLVLLAMFGARLAGWPMNAETAVLAAIAGCWLTSLGQFLLLERRLRTDLGTGARRHIPRTWLATSLPLLLIAFCEILLQTTDVLVISHLMTPKDAAIYYAAAKTMSLVLFIHYAVGSAVAKRFSALDAAGDTHALRDVVRQAVSWTFWPSIAVAAAIVAAGHPVLAMFGPDFTSAYPVMFVLAMGYLARAAMGPSEFVLNMLGQQRACAAISITAAAFNITLALILVPRHGIMGAAYATAAAYTLAALLNSIMASRRLGLPLAIWRNVGWR